jgi:hypothetical protein
VLVAVASVVVVAAGAVAVSAEADILKVVYNLMTRKS